MISKGKRIKKLRESNNMTQDQLAEISNTSKQTIYKYETDKITNIPSDKIEVMAEAFGVSPAYLMGWDDNIYPVPKSKENIRIKVYGSVPAGVPIEAVEDVVDFEDIPAEMAAGGTDRSYKP